MSAHVKSTIRVLGLDPGSRITGYGVIEVTPTGALKHLSHGIIRLPIKADLPRRLAELHLQAMRLMQEFKPDSVAIERVFFARNAASALQLGQARGVLMLSAAQGQAQVHEYAPTQVKSALTRHGAAAKEEVAQAVRWLLRLGSEHAFEMLDASDALALAICHAGTIGQSSRLISSDLKKRGRASIARSVQHRLGKGIKT